jgi:ribose transport system permease protein
MIIINYLKSNPLIVIILFLFFGVGVFKAEAISYNNLTNILQQAALIGIVATGMTFVIISGGIDLSVGSVMAFSSVYIAGFHEYYDLPVYLSIILTFIICALLGAFTGILICKLKIPPFLASLGMMGALLGYARLYSDAQPIGLPGMIVELWTGKIFFIPIPIIIWFLVVIIAYIFQKYHEYGRSLYAIGNNIEAAHFSGINIDKWRIIAYSVSAVLACLVGLLYTARLNSGQSLVGRGFELIAIAAVCAGGTNLLGGSGSVVGTVLGAILIALLGNSLSFLGFSSFYQEIGIGVILVLAVGFNIAKQEKQTI